MDMMEQRRRDRQRQMDEYYKARMRERKWILIGVMGFLYLLYRFCIH